MVSNMLCKIGLHKWERYKHVAAPNTPPLYEWRMCWACKLMDLP